MHQQWQSQLKEHRNSIVVLSPVVETSKMNEKRMRRHQSVAAIQEEHLRQMKEQSQRLRDQRDEEIDSKVETETERSVLSFFFFLTFFLFLFFSYFFFFFFFFFSHHRIRREMLEKMKSNSTYYFYFFFISSQ